jgi:hypothetical protein
VIRVPAEMKHDDGYNYIEDGCGTQSGSRDTGKRAVLAVGLWQVHAGLCQLYWYPHVRVRSGWGRARFVEQIGAQ